MLPSDPENMKGRVIDVLRARARGRDYSEDLLARYETSQGQEFAKQIRAEAAKQWAGGNQGYGDWIDE